MNKKILIVASVWGFAAKFESEDIRILKEMGYEVHFVSNKNNPIFHFPENVYENMGVIYHDTEIWQSPFGIRHNVKAMRQIRDIIQKEQIKIVHCHTPSGGLVARLAAWGTAAYVIYTAHGFHFYKGADNLHNFIYYTVENFLSRMTDVIVTINHEDYQAAKKMGERVGTYLIPGVGLDRKQFHEITEKQRRKARNVLGIDGKFLMLGIGELRENKNPAVIIKALAYLKDSGIDISPFVYGLVGEGKQEQELRELAKENGVLENVIFYGYQMNVRPYLMAADIMIFPTIREGLGMAALEALAMGVPVLAADNRGTREYMRDNVNGYVCRENSPEAYAAYILKLYTERKEWGENMGRRVAIRKTTEGFDKAKTAVVMKEIYESAGN
ncbi:MAG: glycosyltransferase family 4 protein [Clostridium sp.]|nr:glycosyltransferase family 4 protein [Clostridium sp.]